CRMGRYDRGIASIKDAVELDPNSGGPHHYLAVFCYEPMRMYTEALEEARRAVALEPSSPLFLGRLGWLCARHGDKAEAVGILEKLKKRDETHDTAEFVAYVYVGLGDHDSAFTWLEKAYQRHSNWVIHLQFDPPFDPLRSDPRFVDLLRRMGFPE